MLSADPRFAAGAAVFALDQVERANPVWLGCWRMRLTLRAAVALARRMRLSVDAGGMRDALHLTHPGDDPGPAGRLHLRLRRWAARPLRLAGETKTDILREIAGSPVAGEIDALIAADRALAERLGWEFLLPLHLAAVDDPVLHGGPDDLLYTILMIFPVASLGWIITAFNPLYLAPARVQTRSGSSSPTSLCGTT